MSKKVSSLILSFFLLLNLPLYAFAANQVETMDIQALIYQDGSMQITQIWEGSFDQGTEVYIPMNAPDYLTISELYCIRLGSRCISRKFPWSLG